MSRKQRSDLDICPVCGEKEGNGHECEPRLLEAMDRAMKGDPQITRPAMGMTERLRFGFAALHGECGDDSCR